MTDPQIQHHDKPMSRKLMSCRFPNNRVKPHQISEINAVPIQQVPVASVCMMHQNVTMKKNIQRTFSTNKLPC